MTPQRIHVTSDYSVPVIEVPNHSSLGSWDEVNEHIVLLKGQPEAGKILILIHEMIHIAETMMISGGLLGWTYRWFIRPLWGEILVTHLGAFLFQMLALSDMLTVCEPEEAKEFIENELPHWNLKAQ